MDPLEDEDIDKILKYKLKKSDLPVKNTEDTPEKQKKRDAKREHKEEEKCCKDECGKKNE